MGRCGGGRVVRIGVFGRQWWYVKEIGDWVVKSVWLHAVPGPQEDDVGHEDLVLEGGAEVAFRFAEGAFDLSPNAGDGTDGCSFEFGDLDGGAEHVANEGGVAEDLIGLAGQLEFLDDLRRLIDVKDDTCCGDTEARIGVAEGLNAAEAGVGCDQGTVEGAEAVHMLRSVF